MRTSLKGFSATLAGASIAAVSALPANAHETMGAGLSGGFIHPFTGVDHLLVMLSVGGLAALRGSRADLGIPLAFLGALVGGALLAVAGAALPVVEPMVLASLLAVGCLFGASARISSGWAAAVVAFFAVFHGMAHGSEIPLGAGATEYVFGMSTAAALLLASGWAAATVVPGVLRLQRG